MNHNTKQGHVPRNYVSPHDQNRRWIRRALLTAYLLGMGVGALVVAMFADGGVFP